MVLDRSVQQLAAISTGLCGEAALWGSLITAVVMVVAGCAYLFTRSREVLWFVRAEVVLLAGLLTAAAGALLAALLGNDFSLAYVTANSERTLGIGYKIAAFWAGQEGSLLLWAWALGIMGVVMAWQMRRAEGRVVVLTLGMMAVVAGFLVALMLALRDPFLRVAETPADGTGLRPALQNLAMVFHPPLLFLGYAGYAAPWAFMLGGLFAGRGQARLAEEASDVRDGGKENWVDQWVLLARPWMVFSWVLLGVGIILGAAWAYVALGWGGYWAWDAVENASLLPWLTGTALLHSALLQVRQGVFRRWTATLTAASFFLCILGTYITRSGIVNSVHAFAPSAIGTCFFWFMVAIALASAGATVWRLPALRGDRPLEALLSREGFFLMGNVLLVVMTVAIIVGTLYPALSGALGGTPVTVGGGFYNKVVLPMALVLAGLMATGPVLGSGAAAFSRARQRIGWMILCGLGAALAVGWRDFGSLSGLMNAWGEAIAHAFTVAWNVLRFKREQVPWEAGEEIIWLWMQAATLVVVGVVVGIVIDLIETTQRARAGGIAGRVRGRLRHWGSQLAHLGLAAVVAGVAGSSLYGQAKTMTLRAGPGDAQMGGSEASMVGGYSISLEGIDMERRSNHVAEVARIWVADAGVSRGRRGFEMLPERRLYDKVEGETVSEVAVAPGLIKDVYVTVGEANQNGGGAATVVVRVNPLVSWIWIGGGLMTLGGLVCLLARNGGVPGVADGGKEPEKTKPKNRGGKGAAAGILVVGLLAVNSAHGQSAPTNAMTQAATMPAMTGSLNLTIVQGSAGGSSVAGEKVLVEMVQDNKVLRKVELKTDSDGMVTIPDIPLMPPVQIGLSVEHGGMMQHALAPMLTPKTPTRSADMRVYDVTEDMPAWKVETEHVILGWKPDGSGLMVTEMLRVNNPADRIWLGKKRDGGDGRVTVTWPVPAEAAEFEFGEDMDHESTRVVGSEGGAAGVKKVETGAQMFPGSNEFDLTYTLPMKGGSINLPIEVGTQVENLMVLAPVDGMQLEVKGLAGGEIRDMGGTRVRVYQAENLAAGQKVGLTIAAGRVRGWYVALGAALWVALLGGAAVLLRRRPSEVVV